MISGTVRHIELLSAGWEEVEFTIPDDTNVTGYTTGERTVVGSVVQVLNDDVLVVTIGDDQEQNIELKEHPDLKWKFVKGDNVSLKVALMPSLNSLF